ncbi:MAG: glycoside hydrolase family 127 protein, partial [Actinomycetota bacterium]|nr:glycoside hydrolase family 127 protein [Actinomycetota bacterium]
LVVRAHAGPQPFDVLGLAVGFLARAFELWGDDADLDAAVELHDLVVALGDDVWDGPEAWRVGWGAALLYAVTGDEAFLATTERVADLLCETQLPDGTWGSPEATAEAALVLREMADAVESRAGIE